MVEVSSPLTCSSAPLRFDKENQIKLASILSSSLQAMPLHSRCSSSTVPSLLPTLLMGESREEVSSNCRPTMV